MAQDNLYSQALMEHVAHPDFNYVMDDATMVHDGINPSCGDTLHLHVKLDNDKRIQEISWTGHGCAISQASADMMSDLMEGKTIPEARATCQLFCDMILGKETDEELLEEQLDEACCLQSISHMPARVKCAELGWRTLDEMLRQIQESEE